MKLFLGTLVNKKLNNVYKLNQKIFMTGGGKAGSEKESELMSLVNSIFIVQDMQQNKKIKSIDHFMEETLYDTTEFLESSLLEIPKSKRTQIASLLIQIKSQTNEMMNKSNVFENENVFAYETFQIKLLKQNIRNLVMKEILVVVQLNNLPIERL